MFTKAGTLQHLKFLAPGEKSLSDYYCVDHAFADRYYLHPVQLVENDACE